jgi:hypothetical protein
MLEEDCPPGFEAGPEEVSLITGRDGCAHLQAPWRRRKYPGAVGGRPQIEVGVHVELEPAVDIEGYAKPCDC